MFLELQNEIINLRNVCYISVGEKPEIPEMIIIRFIGGPAIYKKLTIDELADFKKKVLAFNTK